MKEKIISNNKIKIIDYINDYEIHDKLFCTYKYVFIRLFQQIITNETKLNNLLNEQNCSCLSCKLTNLIKIIK